jgi:glyoxylase-like metal-dependent hydrolase (beta-lactamase superfamily II)
VIDRPGRQEWVHTRNEFAGFVFEDEIVVRDGRASRFDLGARLRESVATAPPIHQFLPQRYLAAALANPLTVRSRGTLRVDGSRAVPVEMVENGAAHILYFDEESGLLLRVDALRHTPPYGDGVRTYRFFGRQTANGLTVPKTVEVSTRDEVLGTTRNRFELSVAGGAAPIEAPEGLAERDFSRRPGPAVRRLGPDVFLVENVTGSTSQWSYNVLFAEFEDHVLVAEAPLDEAATDAIFGRIAAAVPNKEIRYLVQSHHHDDHIGGIRGYVARGTRLVVSPGNVPLIERIARAPYASRPDALARRPRAPRFERVAGGPLVLKDARLEARVYDVGPTSHADEMLVVYFPAARILFQSDLVNAGEFPAADRGRQLAERVRSLGLQVDVLAGAHGGVVSGDELRSLGF